MKLYVVYFQAGLYDHFSQYIIGVYSSREAAEIIVESLLNDPNFKSMVYYDYYRWNFNIVETLLDQTTNNRVATY
jgi:hypothetical protein